MLYHEEKDSRVAVHGDDFTALGASMSLDWLREVVQRRMQVKFKGTMERGKPEPVRIANRIVTVTENELAFEADQRHTEILMRHLGHGRS